jgi:hypothetical protein
MHLVPNDEGSTIKNRHLALQKQQQVNRVAAAAVIMMMLLKHVS